MVVMLGMYYLTGIMHTIKKNGIIKRKNEKVFLENHKKY